MHKITIGKKQLFAAENTILSDILLENGEHVEHPCGRNGTCKKCTVLVDGQEVLACQYRVHSDICVSIPEVSLIKTASGAAATGHATDNTCFVLDIGTTTLALALVSLDDQKIVQTVTRNNPQRAFGADVMSRIEHCQKHGVSQLTACLISTVNEMIACFSVPAPQMLYVAGNTTMLHLFFGVDCTSLGVAPYTPVFLDAKSVSASQLGIVGVHTAESLPSISAFVGADLVAGLHLVERPTNGKYRILVDLGTNAEILLFSRDTLLCTAAAAGPCFEGTNISCGMSATKGAIYAYRNGQAQTIENAPPKGICGTGLIDIIACLVDDGTIDETGFMECGTYQIAPGITLSQKDIRQFQLAKSAVYAGITTLLKKANISLTDVETIYISGGFSAQIHLESAVKTGLLSKDMQSKCKVLNNSCLLGTIKFACKHTSLSALIHDAEYVDLSADPFFSDLFVENMLFDL